MEKEELFCAMLNSTATIVTSLSTDAYASTNLLNKTVQLHRELVIALTKFYTDKEIGFWADPEEK